MRLVMVQLGLTSVMVGLIWMVQLVHYPLFAHVGASTFGEYHAMHMQRISWIVMPVMVAELTLAAWLAWQPPMLAQRAWFIAGLCCVIAAWGSTAAFSVPAHGALSSGANIDLLAKLVATNWPRTLAWTAHQGILVWVLWQGIGALEASAR